MVVIIIVVFHYEFVDLVNRHFSLMRLICVRLLLVFVIIRLQSRLLTESWLFFIILHLIICLNLVRYSYLRQITLLVIVFVLLVIITYDNDLLSGLESPNHIK